MVMNIGMIGTGLAAEKLLAPALAQSQNAQLWSVLSRDAERGQAAAGRMGAHAPQPVHTDLHEMLADPELDALVIASPDKLHADQAVAAAEAGKHVLVEKPMVTDMAEGQRMIDACNAAGITLAVAYHMRWHAGHRALQAKATAGELGTLRHMRVIWPTPQQNADGWRAGKDVGRWWGLAAVGTHCLDQIRWFMTPTCGEVVELKSIVSNAGWNTPRDETAVLAMKFENGATAEMCSSVLFNAPKRMEVYGSDGYAVFDDTLGPTGGGAITTDRGAFEFEQVNPYLGEIDDFVKAAQSGNAPEVGGKEGLRNVELLLKAVAADP